MGIHSSQNQPTQAALPQNYHIWNYLQSTKRLSIMKAILFKNLQHFIAQFLSKCSHISTQNIIERLMYDVGNFLHSLTQSTNNNSIWIKFHIEHQRNAIVWPSSLLSIFCNSIWLDAPGITYEIYEKKLRVT